jgi:hypothetical protein
MTGNREDLAGRPRGGRHGLLTTRAGTFSRCTRDVGSTPSHRCPHGRPLRAPIASCRPGTCPLTVVAALPRAHSFRAGPPWSRLRDGPPAALRGPALLLSRFPRQRGDAPPRMQGEPLEELR